jgi:hypothetical protein
MSTATALPTNVLSTVSSLFVTLLPIATLILGSWLSARQTNLGNKAALEQSRLQVEADFRKIQLQAEREDNRRIQEQDFEAKKEQRALVVTANKRTIEKLEALSEAVAHYYTVASNKKIYDGEVLATAQAEVLRYSGIAQTDKMMSEHFMSFVDYPNNFDTLVLLTQAIENTIIHASDNT